VQADIEAQTEALSGLRDREKALTQKRATLEATAREAESIRESMASLDDRIEEHRDEIEALTARIEEAEALLEDRTPSRRRTTTISPSSRSGTPSKTRANATGPLDRSWTTCRRPSRSGATTSSVAWSD
jgi:hypothetical protein